MSTDVEEQEAGQQEGAAAPEKQALAKMDFKSLLNADATKERLKQVLGNNAGVFTSSIMSVFNGSPNLQLCTPPSIINAGFQAAAVKLSINPSLGHAAIIPYQNSKKVGGEWVKTWEAQFQIMWKGIVQLALRTGQYKRINLAPVFEGQLLKHDPFTGEVKLDAEKKTSEKVVGFYFYFSTVNGYVHEAYWPIIKCMRHGLKFSKSFQKGYGKWTEDPNVVVTKDGNGKLKVEADKLPTWVNENSGAYGMCAKTVVKMDFQKWGILSIEMEKALEADQAVIDAYGKAKYVDNPKEGEEKPEDQAATEAARPRPARKTDKAPAKDKSEEAGQTKDDPTVVDDIVQFETVAATEVDKKPARVCKTDEGVKFYTRDEKVADFIGKAAKETKRTKVSSTLANGIRWIEQVAAA